MVDVTNVVSVVDVSCEAMVDGVLESSGLTVEAPVDDESEMICKEKFSAGLHVSSNPNPQILK